MLIHLILSTILLRGHHCPYFTNEKTGTQRFSGLPKVIQLISGKAGIRTQPFFSPSWKILEKLPYFSNAPILFYYNTSVSQLLKRYFHYARTNKALQELIFPFSQTCFSLSCNIDSPVLATELVCHLDLTACSYSLLYRCLCIIAGKISFFSVNHAPPFL